jgi:radical SAM superfamily enzyme YgiQ (UPF0313 family)
MRPEHDTALRLDGLSVLLVNPPLRLPASFVNYPSFAALGLLYTAGRLERLGAEVRVLDAFLAGRGAPPIRTERDAVRLGTAPRALAEEIGAAPDAIIIGASMFAHPGLIERTGLPRLFRALRRRLPRVPLILADCYAGGLDYLPYDPVRVLRSSPELFAVCSGEGESALPPLLAALGGRRSFSDLPRCAHRERTGIRRGAFPGPLCDDLDELAPAFHLIDMDRFFAFQERAGELDLIHEFPGGGRFLPLLSSRGCPFACSFCAKGFPGYRAASAPAVLARVQRLQRAYRPERVFFLDDCMNADPRRFSALARGLRRRHIPWEAPNGFRADRLQLQHVRDMAAAGMTAPSLSLESGDDEVRRRLVKKSLSLSHLERAAAWFAEAGLRARVHGIIGFPGETRRQINRTLAALADLAERYGAEPRLQFATPVPGTPLYRAARAGGHLLRDTATMEISDLFTRQSLIRTREFSPADLRRFQENFERRIRETRERKLLLAPSYRCNNRCSFCCTSTLSRADASLARLRRELDRAAREGVRQLDIDGGEPTLFPHLPELIEHARTVGIRRITLVTNARRAAYPAYAARLKKAGLDAAVVTLLAPEAATHDELTRVAGSFAQAVRGIRALRDTGIELLGNTVLLPENLSAVPATVRLLLRLGCRSVNLQYPLPIGEASRRDFGFPHPDPLRRVLSRLRSGERSRIQLHNLAPCLLGQHARWVPFGGGKRYLEMLFAHGRRQNFGRMLETIAHKLPACDSCAARVLCPGLWRHQIRAGLRPRPL